jgi:pimeloyl-ACP methyl ester carboxylesterase
VQRSDGLTAVVLARRIGFNAIVRYNSLSTGGKASTWAQQAAHSFQNKSHIVGQLQKQAQNVKQRVASQLYKKDAPLDRVQLSKAASNQLKSAFAAATLAAGAIVKCNVPTWKQVTPDECADACKELLSSVVTTPFKTYRSEQLYTIELEPPYKGAPALVLLHGYGSGSGMWAFNLDQLAQHFHVYAVDWLGCGASERPPFTPTSVSEGERWFTESFERWRAAQKLEKPIIVGHSLGGYLSAAYALHHPLRVAHLVLVSPAGIPVPPDPELLAKRRSHWVYGLLQYAWGKGVTPQSLVRALGPWGEKWTTDIISRRFQYMLEAHEQKFKSMNTAAFVKYLYQITAADGSGEFALNVLLSFGAHAREPMGPRLLHAAETGEVPEPSDAPVAGQKYRYNTPTTFIYGQGWDWMPADAGFATAQALRRHSIDATALLVPQSGHHLYMEQPDIFAAQLISRLTPNISASAAARKAK